MTASSFDRLHLAIRAIAVDPEAEADFRRLPDEVALFARRYDDNAAAEMRAEIAAALPECRANGRRVLNPRPHVHAEVRALRLVTSCALAASPSEEDLRAAIAALGRRLDLRQGKPAPAWASGFAASVGATPAGIDPMEWVSLQVIVACRHQLASGMALRRALVGLLAWCHVLGRVPPATVIVAFSCVVGVIDAKTAAPIWPRLAILAGVDARLALAIAACDVEAGGRASNVTIARIAPHLLRQNLSRLRRSTGYRRAFANIAARQNAALESAFIESATPFHNPKMSIW